MRKYRRKALWGALALAVAVGSIALATRLIALADTAARADITYHTADGDDKPGFDTLDGLRDAIEASNVPGTVAAYAQTVSRAIQTEDGVAKTKVDALWVDGYAGLFMDAHMLAGLLPVFAGQSDCALDAATALTLFGSTDIVGQKVTVDDLELTVCGVFTLPEGLLAWGASPGRGIALCPAALMEEDPGVDALAFTVPSGGEKDPKEQSEQWMGDAGISVPSQRTDKAERHALYTLWGEAFALLAALWTAWTLVRVAVQLLMTGIGRFRRIALDPLASSRLGLRALLLGLAGGVAALGAAAAIVLWPPLAFHVPPSYLPTRWSDLSFWPKLLASRGEAAAQRAMEVALRPELLEQALLRWVPWLGCLALVLGCLALHTIVSPIPKVIRTRNHMEEVTQ